MAEVVKVFTPIRRVPIMIGKSHNGQKLPFGPYTLLQVGGGCVVLSVTAIGVLTIPANPAITFVVGVVLTVVTMLGLGLIRYTGIRVVSRALWVGRILFLRKPVSASGIPVADDSGGGALFVEESLVLMLPEKES